MIRQPNRYARRSEQVRTSSSSGGTYYITPGSTVTVREILVPSWSSSGGRWYYDLVHGLGRNQVFINGYDTHTNQYINFDQLEPLTPDNPGTLRIWITWPCGANRISLCYF